MREDERIAESTLDFQHPLKEYEQASVYPLMYRALGREPRAEHPFHIYEDILRQPDLVAQTLEQTAEGTRRIADAIKARELERIALAGIGTSLHLGMSVAYALWRLASFPAEVVQSYEMLVAHPIYDFPRCAFLGCSASGNTIETVEATRRAVKGGSYTVAVVNVDNTRLIQLCDDKLVAREGRAWLSTIPLG